MESAALASFEKVCYLMNNSIDTEKNIEGDDYIMPTSMNLIQFTDLLQSMVSNLNMKIIFTAIPYTDIYFIYQYYVIFYFDLKYTNITYMKYNVRVINRMIMKLYLSLYYN